MVKQKEKSRKGKEKVANNCHPHKLSRGGYELLTETILAENSLLGEYNDRDPSPPPRHESWKRARQTKDGSYTSTTTQAVAEKIVIDVTDKGNFVPKGRNDILKNAHGKAEHGGKVRGVGGRGDTFTNCFGRASRSSPNINEQLSQLEARMRAEFEEKIVEERQIMRKTMMETLKSVAFSQNVSPTKQVVDDCSPKHVAGNYDSMKASCSVAPANIKEDLDNDTDSTRVQPNDNDCRYYVMKNMLDIVSASITKNWMEVFNDPTSLTDDKMYDLRNRWATCFLDLFNPKVDHDDAAEEA
ncbi:hypothetical protein TSUD_400460 [Trifolium subterraneum]|uniref:Uncharacterized protein n=1 Tax=Trifolium subterraneum TaxID=3900 RepID=A0A2Z6P940_TRISU|nr:hypothetical protein TSUD_400460 [Trifolium subterraneum]